MVSAQAPGKLRFYRRTNTGSKVFLFGNSISALGPSGSVDGVIASTPDTWTFIPLQNSPNKVLNAGDRLEVTFEANAGVTIDASDCEWIIPITFREGSTTTLSGPDSSTDWDVKQATDIAFVAGVETLLCSASIDQAYALGSNVSKCFASVENNA